MNVIKNLSLYKSLNQKFVISSFKHQLFALLFISVNITIITSFALPDPVAAVVGIIYGIMLIGFRTLEIICATIFKTIKNIIVNFVKSLTPANQRQQQDIRGALSQNIEITRRCILSDKPVNKMAYDIYQMTQGKEQYERALKSALENINKLLEGIGGKKIDLSNEKECGISNYEDLAKCTQIEIITDEAYLEVMADSKKLSRSNTMWVNDKSNNTKFVN